MASKKSIMKCTSAEQLDIDLDARLVEVWLEIWERDEWLTNDLGPLLRLAYGRGYCDALTEPDRGQLCRDHGFLVPKRLGRR